VEKNTRSVPVSIRVGYGCHSRVKNRPRTHTRIAIPKYRVPIGLSVGRKKNPSRTCLNSGRVQIPPIIKKSSPYPYLSYQIPDGHRIPVPKLTSHYRITWPASSETLHGAVHGSTRTRPEQRSATTIGFVYFDYVLLGSAARILHVMYIYLLYTYFNRKQTLHINYQCIEILMLIKKGKKLCHYNYVVKKYPYTYGTY
jgi:hypothetical protein